MAPPDNGFPIFALVLEPRDMLNRMLAESAHIASLAAASSMWSTAATVIQETEEALHTRTRTLMSAWHDEAASAFNDVANDSVKSMMSWHQLINSYGFPGGSIPQRIDEVVGQYPHHVEQLRTIADQYDRAEKDNNDSVKSACVLNAAKVLDAHMSGYRMLTGLMRNVTKFAKEWAGPRSAVAETGAPVGGPTGVPAASGAGTPGAAAPASVPDPATVDPATQPESPAAVPVDPAQVSDALGAAANALQAAQGLLDGTQVPDAVPAPDLSGLGLDPEAYQGAQYGQPVLSGLDAGGLGGSAGGAASAGGVTAGGVNLNGPGIGGAIGAGSAPVPGMARAAGAAAAVGSSPPMYPPNAGGAAANARQSAGGIKPGNSDRPAESRPRVRRAAAAMTPGVALAGRAGAAAPRPAARRGWDSDNDSLQVLDEHLWQVTPQEEDPHGQDRRLPDRDGHDRRADRAAPDAGLVGPGGRADQPTRAR